MTNELLKLIKKSKTNYEILDNLIVVGYEPLKAYELLKEYLNEPIPSSVNERINTQLILEDIIKLLNEGWYPNWNNSSEYKFFNYFKMDGGFSYWYSDFYNTYPNVPSALCLKSQELARFVSEHFLDLYKKIYE